MMDPLFLVARVKEVGVEVPVIDRKQIHVPVAKAHGGYGMSIHQMK